jgi:phosphoribosylanthranilate isomerase
VSRVRVKICGITTLEDAHQAVEAGADALGFVFWPQSRRFVDAPRARAIAAQIPPFVVRVGVFVNASPDELVRTCETVGLDVVQLHGDEPPEALEQTPRRAVKALRVDARFNPSVVDAYAARAPILLDTGAAGVYGGSGETFDWSRARLVRARVPHLILAGGLTAANVAQAVAAVRPDAVDVSGGVESTPGRKDPAKVRAFLEAVRGVA